jgi:excisionase family DNA binding protein
MTTWFTVTEIARHLRTSPSTVYKLKERGEIRGYRVGRQILFDPDEVDEDIKRSEQKKSPSAAEMEHHDDETKREIS